MSSVKPDGAALEDLVNNSVDDSVVVALGDAVAGSLVGLPDDSANGSPF